MTFSNSDLFSGKLLRLLGESAQRSSQLHRKFLEMRQVSLEGLRDLIALQIGSDQPSLAASKDRTALFNSQQIDRFGTGKISDCLGPHFVHYDNRQIPRIPNGDLKMMSRVMTIQGIRGDFSHPANITVEYDVPVTAWYLRDNASPIMPYSLLMETALQPCGFLSAYLDTYAFVPYNEFYFRNLDGFAQVGDLFDLRGQTITTQAHMLSSVVSSGTVIQKYAFELTCAGQLIYQGESTFGYFSAETMRNQVGLDNGRITLPDICSDAKLAGMAVHLDTQNWRASSAERPYYHLPNGQLRFLDTLSVVPQGGKYGQGYIYAALPVNPQDWYYPCHFYQDPVMPGSLGVEAILEAMQTYALANNLGSHLRQPRFSLAVGSAPMAWRYRGQVVQQNRQIELEVHLRGVAETATQVVLSGDANLWVDGLRIYEIKDAAVAVVEG